MLLKYETILLDTFVKQNILVNISFLLDFIYINLVFLLFTEEM